MPLPVQYTILPESIDINSQTPMPEDASCSSPELSVEFGSPRSR